MLHDTATCSKINNIDYRRMKQVTIYTDGACAGNPGPGGWAAVLDYGTIQVEISGGVAVTTNNRMELQAAIEALGVLKEPYHVELFTDSRYLCDGIRLWLPSWKLQGWKRGKKLLKNDDLWRQLDSEAGRYKIEWRWLKGHSGHPMNERCDQLACAAIHAIQKQFSHAELEHLLDRFEQQRSPDREQLSLL